MRQITAFMLWTALSIAFAMPAYAQSSVTHGNARQSQKSVQQQKKLAKRQAKAQRKAQKQFAKAQRKANKKARKQARHHRK